MEKMGQAAETSAGHASAGERHLRTYHLKQCPVLKKPPFQKMEAPHVSVQVTTYKARAPRSLAPSDSESAQLATSHLLVPLPRQLCTAMSEHCALRG